MLSHHARSSPSFPSSHPRFALARAESTSSSSFPTSNNKSKSKGGATTNLRRAAFDVAVVGIGAAAASAASALSSRNLKTVWLDGLPEEAAIRSHHHHHSSKFHRRPPHAPARLACPDARLVALALEGLEAWRSLGERFDGQRRRQKKKSSNLLPLPLLSEGGCLDLASSVPFANSSTARFGSGSEILEACAEAAREAGVKGARLLSSSELVEAATATTTSTSTSTTSNGNNSTYSSSLLLSSRNLPRKTSAGLWIPQGGSMYLPAADEAAAAGAVAAGVERWGPAFRVTGWRDAGGGSRFEVRGKEGASSSFSSSFFSSSSSPDDLDDAPVMLAEVERLVLVPPERGFEEFLSCFGIALPSKKERRRRRRKGEEKQNGAELRDVAWARIGGRKKKKLGITSPSFSQLSPCVLSHGLPADRAEASDSGAPRGSVALERWSFVPFNDGGGESDSAGVVSVPPAFAKPRLSSSSASEKDSRIDNEVSYLEFSGRDNGDGVEEEEDDEEEEDRDDIASSPSPFAEDARAAALAASSVIRPLAGSSIPRKSSCYAAETLVTGDGAPVCGWAPLEIYVDDDDAEEEGQQRQQQQQQQQQQQSKTKKGRSSSSFGALGSEPGRVLVLCPSVAAGGGDDDDDSTWGSGGAAAAPSSPCAVPAVAAAAADLLSGLPAVRGPLSAEQLSPTRSAVGMRCVELSRDPWE